MVRTEAVVISCQLFQYGLLIHPSRSSLAVTLSAVFEAVSAPLSNPKRVTNFDRSYSSTAL